ncbi:MAG: molecular chaperone HtpG [Candidatus Riflebacteria bacterium]|nr:molecular chaperone HtpG [Candidatus Riflebacteria bacterium]
MTVQPDTFEFKTEAKQLLDLMIHSVYSNREIFLRELISNASDALDKIRFEALTKDELRPFAQDQHIRIEADKNKRTLSVIDNGIGMNREELVQFIGTIAKSGTKEYLKTVRESQGKVSLPEFIGQFGVGFYSSFMVSNNVEVITRKAGDDKAWKWESKGDGTYSISEASRETPGSSVTLYLKKEDEEEDKHGDTHDYTSEWTIKELVKKYSDFVSYPIKMKVEKREYERDSEGKIKEGTEAKVTFEDEILNSMKAIWTKSEKDVTESEYKEFYKHISHDWNDPLKWITYKAEGIATGDFKGLLYLPSKAGSDLYFSDMWKGIQLYIKRVFIMNDCKELIPEYLRFVKGVIDSDELSLNISREILQQNKQIQNIKKAVSRKVLSAIKALKQDEPEKFKSFWKEFGSVIKEGIFKEPEDKERILETAVFMSTHSSTETYTVDQYIERMKPAQETVYYLTGDTRQRIETSPLLEQFKDKGYEVLLMTDPVDEVWVNFVFEYKGKKFQSIAKGNVDLGTEEEKKRAEEERKQKEVSFKSLMDCFKSKLEEDIKEVRLSSRLTSSPSCLVSDMQDMTPQMEAILKATGKDVPKTKRILEINPTHPIVSKLQSVFEKNSTDPMLADYATLLYGQALLAEGGKLPDPAGFNRKLNDLMIKTMLI